MSALNMKFIAFLILINTGVAFAQTDLWQDVTPLAKSTADTSSTRYFDSNDQALRDSLNLVPHELSGQSATINLPMPDGSLASFSIVESPIMEDGLAEQYPNIKTYKVYGIDDPIASGRVDINRQGFHAMLQTSQGRIFLDPVNASSSSFQYLARTEASNQESEPFVCSAGELVNTSSAGLFSRDLILQRIPGNLLIYRLALSATAEYSAEFGGTQSSVMNELTTAINRVNEIYESDLGIHLNLVAGNSGLIDINNTSPLAGLNGDGISLLSANQAWIDTTIGSANYDIGHVFSTGGGGVAALGAVCNSSSKAWGVTGLPSPFGDPFYIDFVAHEIGHQFGAVHTFNGTTGFCGAPAQRNSTTAVEPGSGSTVMAYAGICGAENIQSNSDATFHAVSISQIDAFVTSGGGASCDTSFAFPNSDPTANAGLDKTIPISTPFRLSGAGTDPDADTLSYQWDQMDAGTATNSTNLGTDFSDNALFRTFVPQCVTERDFPALIDQIDGVTDKAETLPTTSRDLNFRLTVRDGKSGQATDDIVVSVDNTSGPFLITSHFNSGTIAAGSPVTILWNVANTTNASVNCATVDIDLLTFASDHSTYGLTSLATNTPNDTTETFASLPDMSNSNARFRVSCSNNVFYDISDADQIIQHSGSGSPFSTTDFVTSFSTTNTCNSGGSGETVPPDGGPIIGGGGGGGFANIGSSSSLTDMLWLVFLSSLLSGVLFKRNDLKRFRPSLRDVQNDKN